MTLFTQPAQCLPLSRQLTDMLVTTAEDGGQQAGNPGGDQQQQTVTGRLFQGFQQGIGGGLRHPLGIRNDHHLAAPQLGGALQAAADLADGLYPYALAVGTYGAEIRVMTLVQQLTGVAVTAGFTAIRLLAEVQARQSFCKLLLAKAGIPEQQPGVTQATGLGGLAQGLPIRDQPGIHRRSFDRYWSSAASMEALTLSGVWLASITRMLSSLAASSR